MRTTAKLGTYLAGLGLVFGAAAGVGAAVGPIGSASTARSEQMGHRGGDMTTATHDETGGTVESTSAATVAGLEITAKGFTLAPEKTIFAPSASTDFRFRILGSDGEPVRRYEVAHGKELHLIVVRRDLSGYQHVHPTRSADGTWSVPLDLGVPGTYRVLADFTPIGADMSVTLGADVVVAGTQAPSALPEPAPTTVVDGYTVSLHGDLAAGRESRLELSVSRDGRPVTDLQPYLAAYGHLVALRAGDLAYLHVHPDGAPGDRRTPAGTKVVFHAQVPSVGTYRLYFDFQHAGHVRTAEFTVIASGAADGSAGHERQGKGS